MEKFFKKYFWTVHIVIVLVIAYILAMGVNYIVVAQMASLLSQGPYPEEKTMMNPAALADENEWDPLQHRSVFDSSTVAMKDDQPVELEEPVEDPEETEDPSEEAVESDLNASLLGTMVATDPNWSMAILSDQTSNRSIIVRPNYMVLEDARVIAIERHRIVVFREETGKLEFLALESNASSKNSRRGKRPSKTNKKNDRNSKNAKDDKNKSGKSKNKGKSKVATQQEIRELRKGVKKTGEYDYQIDRAMLESHIEDPVRFKGQARIIANYKNSMPNGFKIVGVHPGSLYSLVGIRSGDVIQSVNGQKIDSPQVAADMFNQLIQEKQISIGVERRGRPKSLNYSITDFK